jgi:hypothetical protein
MTGTSDAWHTFPRHGWIPELVVGEPILIQWTWAPACLSYLAEFQLAPTHCNFEISEVHIQFWDWGVDKSLQ